MKDRRSYCRRPAMLLALLGPLFAAPASAQQVADPAGIEFFEQKIRPLFVENCHRCHGPNKQEGNLRLDSMAGIRKGGDRGAAIKPGKPDESHLIQAVRYTDQDLQMPPKSRLTSQQIADLEAWVRQGAPLAPENETAAAQPYKTFDLAERKKHWCYQPVQQVDLPQVRDAAWCKSPIDYFVLAKLEAAGLKPAATADKRTLLRRVTFDMIGLPPTPEELQAFVDDQSPDAWKKVVERLLDSPHYGERWGRHWLDLVRYAETLGHEFDYEIFHAWRYRDYVIRAFNEDVPYNQFVIEHVAGDLLKEPRRRDVFGENESIVGTGFFWLGEGKHSPVDIRQEQANRIDNQIDVFGKTFLAQTIACARCHDHKFDAIATADYYSLAGYLKSTRYQQAAIDRPNDVYVKAEQLRRLKAEIFGPRPENYRSERSEDIFADFSTDDWQGWRVTGEAFGPGPTRRGECILGVEPKFPIKEYVPAGMAHSSLISPKLEGTLRSETFEIRKPFIHYLAAGRGSRINLVIDGFTIIRSPIYGSLSIELKEDRLAWRTMDVSMWQGHRAYIELIDSVVPNTSQSPTAQMQSGQPGDGYLAVDEIRFSDQGPPAIPPDVSPRDDLGRMSAESTVKRSTALLAEYNRIEQSIPLPTYAPAACDGTGEDERVFNRGNYRTLGETAPRRLLPAVCPLEQTPPTEGSGRLELAQRLVDPSNPLVARVMVNRIWKHHFGQGIVRSPDDFGRMGQLPTHPELLDWLAGEFIRRGWSIKQMHRMMLLSSAYQMSNQISEAAEQIDAENRLLHYMPTRRLEAEAIRDAVLAVSGRLDRKQFGPSVMPHLTAFMEGRGRPGSSGPLDGDGRRSIYINVRRNFLTPMFLAFDYPIPFTTIGRRSTSNVPAQALTMMNGPLVAQEARRWAEQVLKQPGTPSERIERMYLAAFTRAPDEQETAAATAFVEEQARRYGASNQDDVRAWTDLCHVLFNVKEFTFID